jgi:hypothetical protein
VKRRANLFANKDIDFDTVTVPLLGAAIDINDLWLISGLAMIFLLYFLRASLEQEHRNIRYVIDNKVEYVPVILMNQVLSVLSVRMHLAVRIIEFLVWMIPTFLYLWLLIIDYSTYSVGQIFLENTGLLWAIWPEVVAVTLVGYFNFRCFGSHSKIRDIVRPLIKATPLAK